MPGKKTAAQIKREVDEFLNVESRIARQKNEVREYHLKRAAEAERLGNTQLAAEHRAMAKNPRLP